MIDGNNADKVEPWEKAIKTMYIFHWRKMKCIFAKKMSFIFSWNDNFFTLVEIWVSSISTCNLCFELTAKSKQSNVLLVSETDNTSYRLVFNLIKIFFISIKLSLSKFFEWWQRLLLAAKMHQKLNGNQRHYLDGFFSLLLAKHSVQ